jgi:hypothetical protein
MFDRLTKHREVLCLVSGAIIALLLISYYAAAVEKFDPATLGFAENSAIKHENFEGKRISGNAIDLKEICTAGQDLRQSKHDVILWLGASQLFSITNPRASDHLAVSYANSRAQARKSPTRYIQLADANTNLNELLAIYLACRNNGFVPHRLILAFVYDDLKEPGIRPEIESLIKGLSQASLDPSIREIFYDTLNKKMDGSVVKQGDEQAGSDNPAFQQRLETFFEQAVAGHWKGFRYRDRVLSSLTATVTIDLARALFYFSERKRPIVTIPQDMEAWNMKALDAIVETATRDGTEMLIYKVPHRPGLKPFYHDRGAYDRYFEQFSEYCKKRKIGYIDLELLVPPQFWGGYTQFKLPDVFHFQDEGHRLLGEAIDSYYEKKENHIGHAF